MATPHTVSFHTLGCKLNYSETSTIRRNFEEHGFSTIPVEQGADIFVLNTCSVTDFADRKCRKAVRHALRQNPESKIVVIGCYAQLKPKEIVSIPGVDLVLGAAEKFNLLNYIDSLSKTPGKALFHANEIQSLDQFESSFSLGDRTRSFLKVQDGCDYKCSFCTIPQARGKSRSDTVSNLVTKANEIAKHGVKEIVLTGVNIGDFGNNHSLNLITGTEYNSKPEKLIHLIKALDKVKGIARFRISSIEPNLCSNEIIDFVSQSEKFVPHFHMPLQSGSDHILRQMRRRYSRSLYADRVQHIKKVMPHACIGADVIVGFPGESTQHFTESYQFIADLDLSYLHVFTYSERPNTPAEVMSGKVTSEERKIRNEMLRILSNKKKRLFYESQVGQRQNVLFENSKISGKMTGFTDNYVKIVAEENTQKLNTIETVYLNLINNHGNMEILFEPSVIS